MIKYVRQLDRTSCGPVAIINTLKWLGCKVSYNGFIHTAKYLCKWKDGRTDEEGGGVVNDDIERALNHLKIKHTTSGKPSKSDLDRHLETGGAALISYFPLGQDTGHVSLCIGKSKKTYVLVNDDIDKTVIRRHYTTLNKMLKRKIDHEVCKVWLILKQ